MDKKKWKTKSIFALKWILFNRIKKPQNIQNLKNLFPKSFNIISYYKNKFNRFQLLIEVVVFRLKTIYLSWKLLRCRCCESDHVILSIKHSVEALVERSAKSPARERPWQNDTVTSWANLFGVDGTRQSKRRIGGRNVNSLQRANFGAIERVSSAHKLGA